MKKLLLILILNLLTNVYASQECPANTSARILSKNYLLVLKFNKDIGIEKNQMGTTFENIKISLRSVDQFHKSLIRANTEFPLRTNVNEPKVSYGPLLYILGSELNYVWINSDFDFEYHTPSQLSIATQGLLELRCSDNVRIIKP